MIIFMMYRVPRNIRESGAHPIPGPWGPHDASPSPQTSSRQCLTLIAAERRPTGEPVLRIRQTLSGRVRPSSTEQSLFTLLSRAHAHAHAHTEHLIPL